VPSPAVFLEQILVWRCVAAAIDKISRRLAQGRRLAVFVAPQGDAVAAQFRVVEVFR